MLLRTVSSVCCITVMLAAVGCRILEATIWQEQRGGGRGGDVLSAAAAVEF